VRTLRLSLVSASLAASLAAWAHDPIQFVALSLVTGAAIGVMTVSLAPLLPRWCGLAWIGLGTGIGYALCNLPLIFMASPTQQAFAGALFTLAGAFLVPGPAQASVTIPLQGQTPGMVAAIATFTALVWMDSAAFFIIQHSTDLKTATWGSSMLWRNAALHLVAALAAGWSLRRGIGGLLVAAWSILAIAALAVNEPHTRAIAGWWYPVGVSLYSTALVAWPGYFSSNGAPRQVAWRAAWLYAVAGWFGSANGIGMVQSLKRVPAGFVIAAGLLVVISMLVRQSAWRTAIAVLAVALIGVNMNSSPLPQTDPVSRGRSVYIAEGCINCHSRYIRPDSRDESDWGPSASTATVITENPVLIGNRRQGPDLSNVGLRRSASWLKLHFLDPRDLSPGSAMPSYRHLFDDGRGQDLIAFLQDIRPQAWQERQAAIASWAPRAGNSGPDPAILFERHCAMCHGSDARGGGPLAPSLPTAPADLVKGPFIWTPPGQELEVRVARVVKFGILGTEMPGHETLKDADISNLAVYLKLVRDAPRAAP
jgi:cytochrome c oxidase cbb3-type subunit 2